ncbi:hypothetical protein BDV93DRAFT_522001 [Ceratobasidium sp. AG-I]|nr:hypothetical protein BDV93DRAFT_522001 [Ceratobasidium sp. AG-I]
MFTPPPSPLPKAHDPLAAAGTIQTETEKCDPGREAPPPARATRRQRLLGLVVPVIVLVLIGLASRRVVEEPLLDVNHGIAPSPRSPAHWVRRMALGDHHHIPRQLATTDPADLVPSLTPTPTATTSAPDTTSPQQLGAGAASTAVPAIPSPPWPVPTPFPQPFDSSLSFNFSTTTCDSFFSTFTTNITFRACRPFSLLLGTSASFFDVQTNLTELTAVMAGTCDTPQTIDQCRSTMDWLASQIVKPEVCATEIASKNGVVLEALNGFKTYDLMRQAGCLVNQRSNAYCFVEAVASTSPSDTYFYALPIGTPVPQKSTPSCSACIKSVMALYASYATDGNLPLSKVYAPAQKLTADTCGKDYAQAIAASAASRKVVGAFSSSWSLLGTSIGLIFGIWSLFY